MFLAALRRDKTSIPLATATTISKTSFRSQEKNTSTFSLSQVHEAAELITNSKEMCPSELTITVFTTNNTRAA